MRKTPATRSTTRIAVILLPFILLSAISGIHAQTLPAPPDAGDLRLIGDHQFGNPAEFTHYHGANNDQALRNRHHSVIAEYNPLALLLKGAMLGYQKLLSEQLARSCPYEITCSNFCKQSIEEFGAFKGIFIGADRILRCNRIGLLDISPTSINPATGAIIDSPKMYR